MIGFERERRWRTGGDGGLVGGSDERWDSRSLMRDDFLVDSGGVRGFVDSVSSWDSCTGLIKTFYLMT